MPDVPTKSTITTAATNGGMNGLAAGLGQTVGRGVLGPGIGTAAGGILSASMLDGNDRDMVATISVERAMNELFSGATASSSSSSTQRRTL